MAWKETSPMEQRLAFVVAWNTHVTSMARNSRNASPSSAMICTGPSTWIKLTPEDPKNNSSGDHRHDGRNAQPRHKTHEGRRAKSDQSNEEEICERHIPHAG